MSKPDGGKSEGDFSVVIEGAKESRLADGTAAFAKTFSVEAKVAEQILKSAPIIFLTRCSKQDVKVLKPKLMDLSQSGIEFRITARPQDRIPKVNWPIKPSFGTGDGGQLVTTVSFIWDNNAFVCPACGETFVFRRVGKPKPASSAETVAMPAAAAARPAAPPPRPAMAPPPRPAAPPPRPAPPPQKPMVAAAKPAPRRPAADEDLGTVDLLDEVPDLDLDEVPSLDAAEAVDEMSPIEEEAPPLDDIEELEVVEEVEEVKPVAKKPMGPPPKGPVKPGGMIRPGSDLSAAAAAMDDDDLCSVFLNRIPTPKDQETAAKIIAEVRSCPIKEAKELAARMVIPVVKDVPKREADEILAKFIKAKIPGRITKKK